MQQTAPDGATRRARRAISVVFAVHGGVSGSFATAIPWIREHLQLGHGWLGMALVFLTVGASAAMPLSARLAHRYGPRRSLVWLSLMCCAGVALPALSPSLVWLCVILFVYGCGLGLMDVAMNAHGVQIEERYGRSVMSGLHGMWSVGTLLGGAGGALAAHSGLDGRIHLGLVAPLMAVTALVASRWVLDVPEQSKAAGQDGDAADAASAAEEPPRFALPSRAALTVGLMGFFAVFAEGASMDWSAIYLRDVVDADPGLAASAFTAFACTMAVARLLGDAVVRRLGPVRTVRASGVTAAAGGVLVAFASTPALAITGFALIGVGVAVVVPLCFAAAGRIPSSSPGQEIAGVATLAYASGLAAPAAVGWIAEATSLSASFGLVTVLLFGLVVGAGVLRQEGRTTVSATAGDSPAVPEGRPASAPETP
ncbi:transporter [Streptomyces abyssalis]|uniref:Transporter n=1 Tax=Streptomyces abyssalis TaxID=933944 RepID=A0A1E7JTA2_9ACTN|nr:MFS transporter [Streptomyces abyssalis]OEU92124.1 transporter [Streptomyces abyssalis]OEU94596.1 transporter [Streptomyces abyssalis]OEV30676.1 transporter [Streptomyces nanshensis]